MQRFYILVSPVQISIYTCVGFMYNVTTFTDNTELTESLDVLSNTHICLKLASPKHCPRLLRVHVVIWCLFGQAKLMATQQERDMAISKLRKCQEELRETATLLQVRIDLC